MARRSLPAPGRDSLPPGGEGALVAFPLPSLDDAALARRAAEGHPGAARIVWDRFSRLVRSLLRRSLGPDADVEDHVQDTFLRFFRHARELRDPSALSSFIVGITMRVARGELRRRRIRRWLSLSDSGVLPDVPAPEVDALGREALRHLYAVLDRVDVDARLIFVLRHIEGLELTQVAAAIGCSLATAKRHLARASARIFQLVAHDPVLAAYVASFERGSGVARPAREEPSHG